MPDEKSWQERYTEGLYNPGADPTDPATLQGQIDSGVYGRRGGGGGGEGGGGGGSDATGGSPVVAIVLVGFLAFLLLSALPAVFATAGLLLPVAPMLRQPNAASMLFMPVLAGVGFLVAAGAIIGGVAAKLIFRPAGVSYRAAIFRLAPALVVYAIIALILAAYIRMADSLLGWTSQAALSGDVGAYASANFSGLLAALPGFLILQSPAVAVLALTVRRDYGLARTPMGFLKALAFVLVLVAVLVPVASFVTDEAGIAILGR